MNKNKNLPDSFQGKSGRFFVLRNEGLKNYSIPKKYAVYGSVENYNNRVEIPFYLNADDALSDFDREIKIYPESLTTTPPAYESDRDETDFGLTPERNFWHNRFEKSWEGPHNAA